LPGANHCFLAVLEPSARDHVIDKLVGVDSRVIRTFLHPEAYDSEKGNAKNTWPDIESPVGSFINPLASVLDHYDDMLIRYTRGVVAKPKSH
jgi:hypothetical protein